jgi:hypothetical protein
MPADSQFTQNLIYPDLQIKSLDGDSIILRKIALMLGVISGVSTETSYNPTQYTASIVVATTSGSVSAGKKQITFTFQPGFTGSVGGQSYTATSSPVIITAPINATLAAIAYTVTAGSVQIVSLT